MNTTDALATAKHFQNISELALLLDGSRDAEESYRMLTQGVCEHSQWDISSIQVLDFEAGLAIPLVRYDPANADAPDKLVGWDADKSPVRLVLKEGTPLILRDAAAQSDYPGFQQDARKRGYHTNVMIPLAVHDAQRRPMVYSVASYAILDLNAGDIGFLKCVADLVTITIRKLRSLDAERSRALRMRSILENMTASLGHALDADAAAYLASGFSSLFPAGWLAVDLTTGRGLFDTETPPPIRIENARRLPDAVMEAAMEARRHDDGLQTELRIDGTTVVTQVKALEIDNVHVGAVFFFEADLLDDDELIAAQAGRLALSAFILRNFAEFRTRRVTARRLIKRLLLNDLREREEIMQEAHQLDFDLTTPCRMLVIRADAETDDGTQSFLLRTAQSVFGPAISCQLDGNLIFLLSDSGADIAKCRSLFLKRVHLFLPPDAALVLSAAHNVMESLAQAHQTCLNSLDVARSMKTTGWITPINIGEFNGLMASLDSARLSEFVGGALPEALMGTSRKAAVARQTIDAFLRSGRRYADAAAQLGIHVSTLRYRLEQLTDQHDLKLDDPDRCFEIELAIRLMNLKNSYDL
ncbi:helix-turn-helix domain-containing protein [Roseovarius aestuarii]|nr:helix-turn-helix domain-containing protein [Roseovarius aestuarii]